MPPTFHVLLEWSFQGKRHALVRCTGAVGSAWARVLPRPETEAFIREMLRSDRCSDLRRVYAALSHDPAPRQQSNLTVARWLMQQVGDAARPGSITVVEAWPRGQEPMANAAPMQASRLQRVLAQLARIELVQRGHRYIVSLAKELRGMRDRAGLEVLSDAEARTVLREAAADPTRAPREKGLLDELLALDTAKKGQDASWVVLRRQRSYFSETKSGPAITPSALRKERGIHWLELELVDLRAGPLAKQPVAVTLADGQKRTGTTDTQGVFRLDDLEPGNAQVCIAASSGRPPRNADSVWSKLELGTSLSLDERHRFEVDHNQAEVIEVDELQVAPRSSVLMPVPAEFSKRRAEWGHSVLSVLAHALRYAADHPNRKLMVVGHAVGAEGDVAALSEARAKGVEQLLRGDAKAWASACVDPDQASTSLLLRWASERHGYDCDPDEVADQMVQSTQGTSAPEGSAAGPDGKASGSHPSPQDPVQEALKRFRQQHNAREKTSLDEDAQGMVAADYEAFFGLYESTLAAMLEMEPKDLSGLRSKVQWHSVPMLGAGDRWPLPSGAGAKELRSSSSRRVDLLFFEGDHPIPDLEATGARAEQVYIDERRVRRLYLPPEPPPPVTCLRMTGLYFDTNKCFLLPGALSGMRKLVKLYEEHPTGELLIVGHADKSGDPDYNDKLSLARAKAMAAYLSDDVDAWLAHYDKGVPEKQRWGKSEDVAMLRALPDAGTHQAARNPLKSYQESRGLEPDGVAGPKTRKQLIADYMSLDGTTLPAGVKPVAHGCGEHFPRFETPDGQSEPRNRRVELFMFDQGVTPKPGGENSKAGAAEYGKWRGQVVRQIKLDRAGPDFVVVLRVHYDVDSHDTTVLSLVSDGGSTLKRAVSDPVIGHDMERSLRMVRFEAVPPGTYKLMATAEKVSYCVLRDIAVSTETVMIGDEPVADSENEERVEGLSLAASDAGGAESHACC